MKAREVALFLGGVAVMGVFASYFLIRRATAQQNSWSSLASIGTAVEIEIVNPDKNITYKRSFDINQWYCRILNSHINADVRGGWRILSLTLGLDDAESLAEADNFVDAIMFLDYFDKPDGSYYYELSLFVDGTWTKTITYLPRNEVLFRFPQDGFFRAICPFPL